MNESRCLPICRTVDQLEEVQGCTIWGWLTTEARGKLMDNLRDILGPTPLEDVAICVEA